MNLRQAFGRLFQLRFPAVIQRPARQEGHHQRPPGQLFISGIDVFQNRSSAGVLQQLQGISFIFNLILQMHLALGIHPQHQLLSGHRMPEPEVDIVLSLGQHFIFFRRFLRQF